MKWMAKKPETAEGAREESTAKGSGERKGEGKRKGGKAPKAEEEDWSWTWTSDRYSDWWSWQDWGKESKSDRKGYGRESKGKENFKGKSKDSGKGKGRGDFRDEGEERGKGKKGKEDGKGKKGGKGVPDAPVENSAKTVAEVEAEMAKGKGKIERVKRSPDSGAKQPIEATGEICQVHKHSSMGCAVVSMKSADMREAIMNYAEHTFGKNTSGRVQMEIGEVKVQLKRHTDKQTKREVVTDIFVAWGHQQEKDSPLTVEDISEKFDQLYKDAKAAPPAESLPPQVPAHTPPLASQLAGAHHLLGGMRVPPPPPQLPGAVPQAPPHMPPAPHAHPHAHSPANPYYNAMCNMMSNPAMNPYLQQQLIAQQAAAYAYQQQLQQQQLMQMYAQESKGGKYGKAKGSGKGKDAGKGKEPAPEGPPAPTYPAPAPAPAPEPSAPAPEAEAEPKPEGGVEQAAVAVPDFTPAKPRLLQIVDPVSGKPIDTMGMNFAPRKPSTPLQITNPNTGEAVAIETKG